MAETTVSSMHDARDAEDRRRLGEGDFQGLLESYYETILQRCIVRCRTVDDASECAQSVVVRLLSELKRGKRYPVPFRVVVHKVIEWTTNGFYSSRRPLPAELPESLFDPENPYGGVELRYDLERAIGTLPPGDAEVARLRLLEGREIEDIAARLGKERNAIDQSLHRARRRLQELLA